MAAFALITEAVVEFVAEESSKNQKEHQIPSDFPYGAKKHA